MTRCNRDNRLWVGLESLQRIGLGRRRGSRLISLGSRQDLVTGWRR